MTATGSSAVGEKSQRWSLEVGGRLHTVSTREISWTRREVVWRIDGAVVASKRSGEEKLVLVPGNEIADEPELAADADAGVGAGALRVIFSGLGAPRRAVWFEGEDAQVTAHIGAGGVDLEPEPGSPLARREEKAARHPRLYAARHVAAGIAKVVLPLVGVWLLARLAGLLPDIDLPAIPWPDFDLPSIPWPDIDLPSIPWPDVSVPEWVRWILERAKFVVPVLIGIALARSEIRRRATAPAKREELRRRGARGDEVDS